MRLNRYEGGSQSHLATPNLTPEVCPRDTIYAPSIGSGHVYKLQITLYKAILSDSDFL